jgi:hypothetical protein
MARFIAETLAVSGQACIETEQADTKLLQDDDDVWTLQIARKPAKRGPANTDCYRIVNICVDFGAAIFVTSSVALL